VKDYYENCLRFLAIISRKFLRVRTEETRNEIDHKLISAAIDQGMWHDEYGVSNIGLGKQDTIMGTASL
jgi:hypothetical protein